MALLQLCSSVQVDVMQLPPEHEDPVTVRERVPVPPQASASQALQEPYWVAGQLTVGTVQDCVSVEVDAWQVPLPQEYVVTERDWVPVPPHALAVHALQLP